MKHRQFGCSSPSAVPVEDIPPQVLALCEAAGLNPACVKWEIVGHRAETTTAITQTDEGISIGGTAKEGPMYRVYVPVATVW